MSSKPEWEHAGEFERKYLDVLIGKTVQSVFLTDDKQGLKFECDDGTYTFILDNSCCSNGWIEHVSGVEDLKGSTISDIRYIQMEHVIPSLQDVDLIYGVKFTHTSSEYKFRTETFLEFRNSSNGYYGSSIYIWKNPPNDVVWREIENNF